MSIELEPVPSNYDYIDCRTDENEPSVFHMEIKRPSSDFFSTKELLMFFEMSPAMLITCLREYKKIIKIYSTELTKVDREWFYDSDVDPVECMSMLSQSAFHYMEVRQLRNILVKNRISLNEEGVQQYLGEIYGTPAKYSMSDFNKSDTQLLQEKNTNSAKLEENLAEALARLVELEQKILQCEKNSACCCDGKGLILVACRMRREGSSEAEIAEYFYDKGEWCSQAQVGVLLHTDESRVGKDTMAQRARRALKLV